MARTKLPTKLCNLDISKEWQQPTERVYEVLGIKARTIPKDKHGTFNVDGHKVVIFKSGEVPGKSSKSQRSRWSSHKNKSAVHRMYFDVDGSLIPVGRIAQFCKAANRKLGLTRLKKSTPHGGKRNLAGMKRR